MIHSIQSYILPLQRRLARLRAEPKLRGISMAAGYFGTGLALSAASLGNAAQPVALGFLLSCQGWPAVAAGIGGIAGSFLFWGSRGLHCAAWLAVGLGVALIPRKLAVGGKGLVSLMAGVIVAALGIFFQVKLDDAVSVPLHFLRILMAIAATWVFLGVQQQDPRCRYLSRGLWVLALAQIAPIPWLGLGYIAAGFLAATGSFATAVLGGAALDLAGITPIPMAAVACLGYGLALLPMQRPLFRGLWPGIACGLIMALWQRFDLLPLPGLLLGGILGNYLQPRVRALPRPAENGLAQVRLEMAAGVFRQVQQLLLLSPEPPIDQEALLQRAVEKSCSSCPCRKSCPEKERAAAMPVKILHQPLLDGGDLPIFCRRENRLLQELHRAQEQLRAIRADRARQKEYQGALVQQYQFLSEYVQELSDLLGRRGVTPEPRYRPEVMVAANRLDADNGDRCLRFEGTGCRYYVLLCDGMGTGLGAVQEGKTAAGILKELLLAGFPAEYALRTLNSLCALRGMAGIVTADLLELNLDTGKAALYKWGAPASWLLRRSGPEKIGTAGPPPGLAIGEARETVERLSLRRGEALVLCSDGINGEELFRHCREAPGIPFGALAEELLKAAGSLQSDDATVAAVRLRPELLE